jgi:hypothetical protein
MAIGLQELFRSWRQIEHAGNDWGLAWYLAYEFCRRFYASHGIVPHVISHEGLGYYGIQLEALQCSVNGSSGEPYGRMAMCGDVENWRSGSPGDHGLQAQQMHVEGMETTAIVKAAIRHMDLSEMPQSSHVACRHKRWGDSYVLCFEIAAMIALRNGFEDVSIWNHPHHTMRAIEELDPKCKMKGHPGAFLLRRDEKMVVIAGDGRMLDGSGDCLWSRYMAGESVGDLARDVESRLLGSDETEGTAS